MGSGWLFSAYYAAKLAGPGALLAWLIGGGLFIIIAFVFAEICSMLPVSGSSVRLPQITHGTLVSFMFSWIIWISYLGLMATEVQAVIQYSSFYFPSLTTPLGALTRNGYITAAVLLLVIGTINTYSVRYLIRCNNIITIFKVIVPLFIIIVILVAFFSLHRTIHPANSVFLPAGMSGVFAALTGGGILYAFHGFKQAAEMAGEAKRPTFSVPIAIVSSVVFCAVMFLLLQISFFSSLVPSNLAHGWSNLTLENGNSPLASILVQDKKAYLLPLLYAAAIVFPLASGMMFCACGSRSIYGMSLNGYLPKFFQHLTPHGNLAYAVIFNCLCGLLLFAPLPGWDKMVRFLAATLAITYAIGPINLIALRLQAPGMKRLFKLPFGYLWGYTAFFICTLLTYWCGWQIFSKSLFVIVVGLIILAFYRILTKHGKETPLNWSASIWVWPYFTGLFAISYFGSFSGTHALSTTMSYCLLALLCLVTVLLSAYFKLPASETQRQIKKIQQQDKLSSSEIIIK